MTAVIASRVCWQCRNGMHLSCTSTGCRCDSALHDPATAPPHQPTGACGSYGGRLPSRPADGGYHAGACEPTTCTCPDGGNPDGLGECGWCRRLVLTHSWHEGRPS